MLYMGIINEINIYKKSSKNIKTTKEIQISHSIYFIILSNLMSSLPISLLGFFSFFSLFFNFPLISSLFFFLLYFAGVLSVLIEINMTNSTYSYIVLVLVPINSLINPIFHTYAGIIKNWKKKENKK